jgi:putative spermidine/putrescine transport system ATP-binding protein
VSGAADKPLIVDAPNTIAVKPGETIGLSVEPAAIRILPAAAP